MNKALQFQKDGVLPESKEGQDFAKEFWDKMIEFTDDDLSMIPKLIEIMEKASDGEAE